MLRSLQTQIRKRRRSNALLKKWTEAEEEVYLNEASQRNELISYALQSLVKIRLDLTVIHESEAQNSFTSVAEHDQALSQAECEAQLINLTNRQQESLPNTKNSTEAVEKAYSHEASHCNNLISFALRSLGKIHLDLTVVHENKARSCIILIAEHDRTLIQAEHEAQLYTMAKGQQECPPDPKVNTNLQSQPSTDVDSLPTLNSGSSESEVEIPESEPLSGKVWDSDDSEQPRTDPPCKSDFPAQRNWYSFNNSSHDSPLQQSQLFGAEDQSSCPDNSVLVTHAYAMLRAFEETCHIEFATHQSILQEETSDKQKSARSLLTAEYQNGLDMILNDFQKSASTLLLFRSEKQAQVETASAFGSSMIDSLQILKPQCRSALLADQKSRSRKIFGPSGITCNKRVLSQGVKLNSKEPAFRHAWHEMARPNGGILDPLKQSEQVLVTFLRIKGLLSGQIITHYPARVHI